MALICGMLFREGSNSEFESGVNFNSGRFRYRPYTYGYCTILPKVLGAADLYALGLGRTIDTENVAVINISKACELLAKLDIEVLW